MSEKIIISTDSTSDIPVELQEKYGIITVPLHVVLDGKTYDDLVNITPDDIYSAYWDKKLLPKTSAINVVEYVEYFKKWTDEGYEVIHISLGGALTSSCQNAS